MPMNATIVVVDAGSGVLAGAIVELQRAGYEVSAATTFDEGKRLLETTHPDLLITAVRLGAFNGLHLVVKGRAQHANMAAIVIGDAADEGLQGEAASLGAAFAVRPLPQDGLLSVVASALEQSPT
jgi:DNA-binding NtrC family response regulator